MNSVFNFFSPKDKTFQPLFEEAGANLVIIAETLVTALNAVDEEERLRHIRTIEKLEDTGDHITHAILSGLEKNFITPFDREDIHALFTAVDDIADFIYAAALNIELYKVKTITAPMVDISKVLYGMCRDINNAIRELRSFKNTDVIAEVCLRVNIGEAQADMICNTALGVLFDAEQDAIELIKQKEILQTLEMASDKCDDAANVLEAILVKNA